MARVLIVDDHAVVRAGYKQFLKEDSDITQIGEAASGNQVLAMPRRSEWDLLLMDIHMPDRSGLDILKHVKSGYPRVPVLIMSGLPEEQYARTVLRSGASGFLSKAVAPDELLKAVHTVLSGRRYVSDTLAESMADNWAKGRDQEQPLHAVLTQREFQMLCKLADGAGTNHIAKELHLSIKTISTYRTRLLAKMGFKTNSDLITYALRNGLIR